MATQSPPTRTSLVQRLRQYWKENQWVYLIVGLAIGILSSSFFQNIQADTINDFLMNLVPEAVGIFFTVLIIDRLDAIREAQVIKDQLVRRLQSRYNHTALQAVEEIRVMGYLEDGTLQNRNLRGANWVDANMYMADLEGSDLGNAILDKADFVLANLKDVNVINEQLVKTDTMHGSIMPDGRKYDGRFHLPEDFSYARRKDINIKSEEAMATWFGVSLEHYREGQRWADENLPRLRDE
jgi:uncharacterized protein YjbI with pentapeptide repeats